ncbi:MAG: ABC transporter ATP-binding protein [Ilumatobacteraceae bacterium]
MLHDLNLACRYAHHIVAMRDGRIVANGAPDDVITAETMRSVFGLEAVVIPDPLSGTPLVVPHCAGVRSAVADRAAVSVEVRAEAAS